MTYFVNCKEESVICNILKDKFKHSFKYYEVNNFLNLKENLWIKKILQEQIDKNNKYNNFYRLTYMIVNGIELNICSYCKKQMSIEQTMRKNIYCCKKCEILSPEWSRKRDETNNKKYGYKTPLKDKSIISKTKETNLRKFGKETFAGSEQYKEQVKSPFFKKNVQKKAINTKIERYGDDYANIIFEKSKNKIMKTNIERYGVPFLLLNNDINDKTKQTRFKKYGSEYFFGTNELKKIKFKMKYEKMILMWKDYVLPDFSLEEYIGAKDEQYNWICNKCGNKFKQKIYTTGYHKIDSTIPRCLNCYPFNSGFSLSEKNVLDFVRSIYDGKIMENSRQVISPFELDIFLPKEQIAIEFDGLYWHGVKDGEMINYQLEKTNLCREKGIKLIHIFEDEWNYDCEMVKLNINIILGKKQIEEFPDSICIDNRYPMESLYSEYIIKELQPPKFHYVFKDKRTAKNTNFGIWDCGKTILIRQKELG